MTRQISSLFCSPSHCCSLAQRCSRAAVSHSLSLVWLSLPCLSHQQLSLFFYSPVPTCISLLYTISPVSPSLFLAPPPRPHSIIQSKTHRVASKHNRQLLLQLERLFQPMAHVVAQLRVFVFCRDDGILLAVQRCAPIAALRRHIEHIVTHGRQELRVALQDLLLCRCVTGLAGQRFHLSCKHGTRTLQLAVAGPRQALCVVLYEVCSGGYRG